MVRLVRPELLLILTKNSSELWGMSRPAGRCGCMQEGCRNCRQRVREEAAAAAQHDEDLGGAGMPLSVRGLRRDAA